MSADTAKLIAQVKHASAWLADQAEINWDGDEVDAQRAEIVSAVETLAATLEAAQANRDQWHSEANEANERAKAAEAQRDTLAAELAGVRALLASEAALAAVEPPEEQP